MTENILVVTDSAPTPIHGDEKWEVSPSFYDWVIEPGTYIQLRMSACLLEIGRTSNYRDRMKEAEGITDEMEYYQWAAFSYNQTIITQGIGRYRTIVEAQEAALMWYLFD